MEVTGETHRNRSQGWKYAKLSGHFNEEILSKHIKDNPDYARELLFRIGIMDDNIVDVTTGGINERNVPSVIGGTTKSKTDLVLYLESGQKLNISLKKSTGGQVYLISIRNFLTGFAAQFGKPVPTDVKRAVSLYWGSAEDVPDIIDNYGTYPYYEKRKHRLTASTLLQYDNVLYTNLLKWFNDNIWQITEFCFSRGLSTKRDNWSDIIWYKNELGESEVDEIFKIEDIANACCCLAGQEISFGNRLGGSTIQLPFGFVQWHSPSKVIPGQIQFHHSLYKIHILFDTVL